MKKKQKQEVKEQVPVQALPEINIDLKPLLV